MKTLEICPKDPTHDTDTKSVQLMRGRTWRGKYNLWWQLIISVNLCVTGCWSESESYMEIHLETQRQRQRDEYKRILWKVLACHFGRWHFLCFPLSVSVSFFFSSRLGGAGDVLLTFRKCQCGVRVRERAPPRQAANVRLSAVILHGSVHKSDYHKNTAENRLLIVLWVCFIRQYLLQSNNNVHLCALTWIVTTVMYYGLFNVSHLVKCTK